MMHTLLQQNNKVWLCHGRYSVHILTILSDRIIKEPVDPVMAQVMELELDEHGCIQVDHCGHEKLPLADEEDSGRNPDTSYQ